MLKKNNESLFMKYGDKNDENRTLKKEVENLMIQN